MKKFFTGVLTGVLLSCSVAVASNYEAIVNSFPIQLNGQNVTLEGYNINGNTYFKLRDIADVVGGFTVDFNDNTIQLSKDGYSYSTPTRLQIAESLEYYSRPIWCPDFGSYTGATSLNQDYDKCAFTYSATQEQLDSYESLSLSLGFVRGTFNGEPNNVVYCKDKFYFVSFYAPDFMLSTSGKVAFVAGAGDWAADYFVAD